jgi:predicted nucleotidyltransferase
MLKAMEAVLQKRYIDFYLVGAAARDIHLSANPKLRAARGTKDIDIAILISNEDEFQMVRNDLIATGYFEPHPKEVIKLFYKRSLEIDLLPFGGIENEYREATIEKPSLFVMGVPGFMEAYLDVLTITIEGLDVNVCSVEGLIVLKLIAHDDRPGRTKDVTDIDNLIAVYFELYPDEIYEGYMDVMELYDTAIPDYLELVSARAIGRKVRKMLLESPGILQRVQVILSKRPTDTWQAMLEGIQDEGTN